MLFWDMRVLLLLLLVLPGCVLPAGSPRDTQSQAGQALQAQASLSPWLNPEAVIASATRLVTPHGIDIRQALYIMPAGEQTPAVLLRLRDYSARQDDRPDAQSIVVLKAQAREAQQLSLGGELAPVGIVASPGRSAWALGALELADGIPVGNAPVVMLARGQSGEELRVVGGERQLPMGFLGEYTLFARQVKAVQVDNGLPAVMLDWRGPAWRLRLGDQKWAATIASVFIPQPRGGLAVGYAIDYDPVLPGQAVITYMVGASITGSARAILDLEFPYHVSYSPFPWLPPLAWVDDGAFATVLFLPDATGKSSRANYQGLFRLVSISTGGGITLIEDHLPPGLPVVAGGGVLFYARQEPVGDGVQWELWAASADGLRKQRLWQVDGDSLFLSVEDLLDGRRLLVQRQYIEVRDGEPQLHSELREFSLEPLAEQQASLGFAPLEPLRQAEGGAGDLLKPPAAGGSSGDGPPPITVPE